MAEASEEEAKELHEGGWVPDVPGGRTHWLHPRHGPVLGVPTARALQRSRAWREAEEANAVKAKARAATSC